MSEQAADVAGDVAAEPVPPTPRRRGREAARDMVWSLAVVGVFVAFLVVVTYRGRPDPVHVVDPTQSIEAAQALAPYEVVVPVGLPPTWRTTSARYEPAASSSVPNVALWHLGFVTPAGAYASVDQADGEPAVLLRSLAPGAQDKGQGSGAFAGWERWVTASGDRQAYVLSGSASTVVVSGTAADAELAVLEGSLVPEPRDAVDSKR